MDEELALLQQELAQVQEEDALQRLSERNVVQLVIKLMEQESVDLIYTFTGKEYLTRKQAEEEIVDEIHANGGRVRLDELSASLKIDLSVVQRIVKSVVAREAATMQLLSSIEIVTSWFLDNCAKVWNETLQEVGSISIGSLATQTALPVDVIQEAVKQRLGSIIHASFDKGMLYTKAFVNRQRAIVRGAFSAATQPTSISSVATACSIEADTVETLLRKMVEEGAVQGRLTAGEFVPRTFARLQRESVDRFFRDNGFIELRQAKAMKVANPFKFIRESFPDAIKLDTAIISHDVFGAAEAAVEECLRNESLLNAKASLPMSLTDKDCAVLLAKIPALKGGAKSKQTKSPALKVLQGHFVVSTTLLQKMSETLKPAVEAAAKKAVSVKPSTPTKAAPAKAAPPKRGGGKKKKGRRRKGDVSDDEPATAAPTASPLDQAVKEFVGTVLADESWATEALAENFPVLLEHEGLATDIVQVIEPTLRGWFSDTFAATLSSLQRGGAVKARKVQQEVEKMLEESYPLFQVYVKSISTLRKRSEELNILTDTVEDLERLLIEPFCLRFLGAMVYYLCTLNNIDFAAEDEGQAAAKFADVEHCKAKAKELSEQMQKQVSGLYALVDKRKIDVGEFSEKLAVFGVDECSLLMRKLDKKVERSVVFGRRQALLAELRPCGDPSRVLTLAIAILLQQCEGLVLPVPEAGQDTQDLLAFLPMVSKILPGDTPQWLASLQSHDAEQEEHESTGADKLARVKELVALKDPRKHSG